jgi:hypothetical protein
MNVEDSYEGAVRRLQRLERAGIAMDAPPPDGSAERMRELEELASLACEDNERLKRELGVMQLDLETARREIDLLRACVAELQASPANDEQVSAPLPQRPFAPFAAASPFPEALPDEDYGLASKSRSKAIVYFFVLAAAAAIVAALCVTRPWASSSPPPPPVEWHVPPPAVTAPPPAAPVQPTVPIAAKAASAPEPAPPASTGSERKRARHPEEKDPAAATTDEAAPDTADDPLAGTKL